MILSYMPPDTFFLRLIHLNSQSLLCSPPNHSFMNYSKDQRGIYSRLQSQIFYPNFFFYQILAQNYKIFSYTPHEYFFSPNLPLSTELSRALLKRKANLSWESEEEDEAAAAGSTERKGELDSPAERSERLRIRWRASSQVSRTS